MASVYPVTKSGNRRATAFRVSFKSPLTDKTVTFQIGKLSKTAESEWTLNLNRLEASASHGEAPPKAAVDWIRKISEKHRKKLSEHGLYCVPDVPKTFAALCAHTIEEGIKKGNKRGTASNQTNALVLAIKYFEGIDVKKADRSGWAKQSKKYVSTITSENVRDFRVWLDEFRPSENSKVDVMKSVIQVMNVAMKAGLVEQNVAKEHKGSFDASKKLHYVTPQTFNEFVKPLDSEWTVILGLAMFAGLRAPSEVNMLRWQDISWDSKQMLVRSTKLAKREVKFVERSVPIFDELVYPLATLWTERGKPTKGDIVTEHRTPWIDDKAQWNSYAAPVEKLGTKHGLPVWSRPLQNLRASFISRKVAGIDSNPIKPIPLPVICKWVGQSELVAHKHYIMLTDENLSGASTWSMESVMEEVKLKVKQHGSAGGGSNGPRLPSKSGFSNLCQSVPAIAKLPDTPPGCT